MNNRYCITLLYNAVTNADLFIIQMFKSEVDFKMYDYNVNKNSFM